MKIHEQLKKRRTDKDLTLKQVGDRAGLSKQRIHQIESGDVSTISAVRKVAKAMECDVSVELDCYNQNR